MPTIHGCDAKGQPIAEKMLALERPLCRRFAPGHEKSRDRVARSDSGADRVIGFASNGLRVDTPRRSGCETPEDSDGSVPRHGCRDVQRDLGSSMQGRAESISIAAIVTGTRGRPTARMAAPSPGGPARIAYPALFTGACSWFPCPLEGGRTERWQNVPSSQWRYGRVPTSTSSTWPDP